MKRLDAMANTANDGLMLPEQVWDDNPPAAPTLGPRGPAPAPRPRSAGPTFLRLAWSIDAGRPVEQPGLVGCRYGGPCPGAAH
jgi:glucoamylase